MIKRNYHGLRYEPEYQLWLNMKGRCHNPRNKSYKYYGAKGVTVCDEWFNDFEVFYNDMCPRPSKDHQLDREDNNGNYCKDNCRWVMRVDNVRNRRDSKWWYVHGVKYDSLGHASSVLGSSPGRIKAWCEGRNDGGYSYPPKDNCWSEKKYND